MAPKLFRPLTNLGLGCLIVTLIAVAFLTAVAVNLIEW